MPEENRTEPEQTGEPDRLPERNSGDRPHWTARPWPLLAAVLAAYLIIHILTLWVSISLTDLPVPQSNTDIYLALMTLLPVCLTLALYVLFFWFIRRAQRKNETAEGISWKTNVAFWIGIPLTLANFPLAGIGYIPLYPISATINFIATIAFGLTSALYFSILFPVVEKQFGTIKGALLISASFAVLAVLNSTINSVSSVYLTLFKFNDSAAISRIMDGFVQVLLSAIISAASIYTLRSALYLLASRRVPGTWLLFVSVPGLSAALLRVVESGVKQAGMSGWTLTLCIEFPYYLLLFALSLGALAGFQKWKTFGEFADAFRRLVKRTQNDVNGDIS